MAWTFVTEFSSNTLFTEVSLSGLLRLRFLSADLHSSIYKLRVNLRVSVRFVDIEVQTYFI